MVHVVVLKIVQNVFGNPQNVFRNAQVFENPGTPLIKVPQHNSHNMYILAYMYILPGPSSTERGFPVLRTGSPTVTPAVNIIRQGIEK